MGNQHSVMFGYLPDIYYDSEPALLFIGSANELAVLAEFIKRVAVEMSDTPFLLNSTNNFKAMANTILWFTVAISERRTKKIRGVIGNEVNWVISFDDAIRFSNLIKELSVSISPAHQYLDSEYNNQLNVIISKGEYTEKVFDTIKV